MTTTLLPSVTAIHPTWGPCWSLVGWEGPALGGRHFLSDSVNNKLRLGSSPLPPKAMLHHPKEGGPWCPPSHHLVFTGSLPCRLLIYSIAYFCSSLLRAEIHQSGPDLVHGCSWHVAGTHTFVGRTSVQGHKPSKVFPLLGE